MKVSSLALHLHEAYALLRLTGPLVLAQLSQTAMGFVDTVMAGRVSAVDLAAVAVGSSIFFPVYLFLIGLLLSLGASAGSTMATRDWAQYHTTADALPRETLPQV